MPDASVEKSPSPRPRDSLILAILAILAILLQTCQTRLSRKAPHHVRETLLSWPSCPSWPSCFRQLRAAVPKRPSPRPRDSLILFILHILAILLQTRILLHTRTKKNWGRSRGMARLKTAPTEFGDRVQIFFLTKIAENAKINHNGKRKSQF